MIFMKNWNLKVEYFILAFTFLLYLKSICPQIFWRDSAEFVATASTLSISHPPGSPTYNLFANLFLLLPFGDTSFKISFCSFFFALLSIFFLAKATRLLIYRNDKTPSLKKEIFIGFSTLFFAVSPSFYRWSMVAEVYSMQQAFLSFFIYLFVLFRRNSDKRLGVLFAILLGFSLGVHITDVLIAPSAFLFFSDEILKKEYKKAARGLLILIFAFFIGASTFLYLPERAWSNAPIKIGNPKDLKSFLAVVTGKRVLFGKRGQIKKMTSSLDLVPKQIETYIKNFCKEYGVTPLIFSLLGGLYLLFCDTSLFLFSFWILFSNFLFFFRIWSAPFGFIPGYLVGAFYIGASYIPIERFFKNFSSRITKKVLSINFIIGFISLVLSFQLFINLKNSYAKNNLFGFNLLYEYARSIADSLDYRSVIITNHAIPQFPLWYLKYVEKDLPSLVLIPIYEFPKISTISALMRNEAKNYNFFWVGCKDTKSFYKILYPDGLIFRFSKDGYRWSFEDHIKKREMYEKFLTISPYEDDYETYGELYRLNYNIYYYYTLLGNDKVKEKEFSTLLKINPNSCVLNLFFGLSLADEGLYKEACFYLKKALESPKFKRGALFPEEKKSVMFAVGVILFNRGEFDGAIKAFSHFLELEPYSFYGHYNLGLAYAAKGKYKEALLEFERCMYIKPGNKEVKKYISNIKKILQKG